MTSNSLLKTLAPILKEFDLSEDESLLLSCMMQLGPRPASALAKHVGFGRGKTYNILTKLVHEEFAQEIGKNGATSFSALPAEVLMKKLQQREKELHEAEELLKTMLAVLPEQHRIETNSAKVEYWRGDAALQVMMEQLLTETGSPVHAFLDYEKRWPTGRNPLYEQWDADYTRRRAALRIPVYVICNKSPASDLAFQQREECLRHMKMVNNISFPIAILLNHSRVIITKNGSDVFGVAIQDPQVVESALELFRSVWASLKDYE